VPLTDIRHKFGFPNDGPIYAALKAQQVQPNRQLRGKRRKIVSAPLQQVVLPPVLAPDPTPEPLPLPEPENNKYRIDLKVSIEVDSPSFAEATKKAMDYNGATEILAVVRVG
jgi:hypothetical protein